MEDLKKKKKTQLSFAPGILFHPTEQQLLSFYLFNKTKQSKNPNYLSLPSSSLNPLSDFDLIQEIDSYNHNPYDLSEIISSFSFGHGGSKKHWYFFTLNGMSSSKNSKRKTEGGFWKLKGRNRNVMDETETGAAILGIKRNFVFYKRNSSHSSDKTDWMMNEYALVDHQKDSYVVCRVFLKSDKKRMEDNNPHSYEKESIAKLHKTSINASYQQLDAPSISGIGEVIAHEDILVDKENEVEKLPSKGTHEADDVAISQQVSDGGLLSSMGFLQSDQVVKLSDGLIMDDDLLTNSTILEGDFIELDDLLLPLVGIDSSG